MRGRCFARARDLGWLDQALGADRLDGVRLESEVRLIIAIDPSSSSIGVALFNDDGSSVKSDWIEPDNDRALDVERIFQMSRYLLEIIDEAEGISRVRIAVIEKPPRHQGPRTNPGAQHAAFGVVYCLCRSAKIQTIEPVECSWVKGKEKDARQWALRQKLGLYGNEDKGGDAIDAYQLGKWAIDRNPQWIIKREQVTT